MWGNSPSTTSTQLFLASLLNPPNFHVLQAWQYNKGKVTVSISALRYPTIPPPQNCAPTHLSIITYQGKLHAIPYFRAPLEHARIDLVSINLVSVVVIFFVPRANPSLSPVGRHNCPRITPCSAGKCLISDTRNRGGQWHPLQDPLLLFLFLLPDVGGSGATGKTIIVAAEGWQGVNMTTTKIPGRWSTCRYPSESRRRWSILSSGTGTVYKLTYFLSSSKFSTLAYTWVKPWWYYDQYYTNRYFINPATENSFIKFLPDVLPGYWPCY